MHAQAQLPGEIATASEQDRVHTSGPHIGTFFVSGPHILDSDPYIKKVDGKKDDYSKFYAAALDALMEQDSRVRNGQAFRITIC
jgi:hypothetical protein